MVANYLEGDPVGRLLLDIVLTGLASLGVLWAELQIWGMAERSHAGLCGRFQYPDIPSALAVWAALLGTVLAFTSTNASK